MSDSDKVKLGTATDDFFLTPHKHAESKAKSGLTAEKETAAETEPDAQEQRAFDDMSIKATAFKKAFGYDANKVLKEGFAKAVLQRTREKWAYDRSVAADQLTKENFAQTRQSEIQELDTTGYLSAQYGLKTAKNKVAKDRGGLRLINVKSTDYNRDLPGANVKGFCESAYREKKKLGPKDPLPDALNFVNSKAALERYTFFYGEQDFWDIEEIGHGVCAVTPTKNVPGPAQAIRNAGFDLGDRMKHLGGMPSIFEAMKQSVVLKGGDRTAKTVDPKPENDKLIDEAVGKDSKAVRVLSAVPDDHAMKSIANAAASLVTGLSTALKDKAATEAFKTDPLIQNSLRTLQAIADAMPTLLEDSSRCLNAYEAMIDEVYLVLAAAKPYDGKACKDVMGKSLEKRAPAVKGLKDVAVGSYLVSSGMDAISTAWQAATKLTAGTGARPLIGKETPEYFEVSGLFTGTKPGGSDDIMTAVLNPSTPQTQAAEQDKAWGAGALIEAVTKRLETGPLVLVLDVTVEKSAGDDGESDLNTVMTALKGPIESSALKVVLAKSYQKYPSLGSGKIMAGSISIIAKQDDKGREGEGKTTSALKFLEETEASLDWAANDESQMMTHFLAAAPDGELELAGQAGENAAFAMQACMPKGAAVKAAKDLPFLLVKAPEGLGVGILEPSLSKMGSDQRDSFGFLTSSHLYVPYASKPGEDSGVPGQRITLGQDSPKEIVEKFWAVGNCLLDDELSGKMARQEDAGAGEVADKAAEAVGGAAEQVLTKGKIELWAADAIRILQARNDKVPVEGLKTLVSNLKEYAESKEKSAPTGEKLRQDLISALKKSEGAAQNLIADGLKLIGCAFPVESGPVKDESLADNPDVMRANRKKVWKGEGEPDPAAEFAPNVAASCLKLIDVAYGGKLGVLDETNRKKVAQLYEAVLSTGMDDLSPGARGKVVTGWAKTQQAALAGEDTGAEACTRLAKHAGALTYPEDKANLLKNLVPEETAKRLGAPIAAVRKTIDDLEAEIEKDKLRTDSPQAAELVRKRAELKTKVAALDSTLRPMFGPLDLDARIELLSSLVAAKQFGKAMACFEMFEADIGRALDGASEMVAPERLSGGSGKRGDAPVALTKAEVGERRKRLAEVRGELIKALNPPPQQPAPQQPVPRQPPQNPQPQPAQTNIIMSGLQSLLSFFTSNK